MKLSAFPAQDGDCLVLRWGTNDAPRRMLIDCGRESTWKDLKEFANKLPQAQRTFELLTVSHIDADHIAGVLTMLTDPNLPLKFRDVWFNAYHHLVGGDWQTFGPKQGEKLSDLLVSSNADWNKAFDKDAVVIRKLDDLPEKSIRGLKLTLLSPSGPKLEKLRKVWKAWLDGEGLARKAAIKPRAKPVAGHEVFGAALNVEKLAAAKDVVDPEPPNGSAIAFIADDGKKRCLFGADAHPDLLEKTLGMLPKAKRRFDLVKLSHHGSRKNISDKLLDMIDCQRFLISTNGTRHHHPDPEAIAKILKRKTGRKTLYFNYHQAQTDVWNDKAVMKTWDYECVFPDKSVNGRLDIDV